jgi:hypothetical protein
VGAGKIRKSFDIEGNLESVVAPTALAKALPGIAASEAPGKSFSITEMALTQALPPEVEPLEERRVVIGDHLRRAVAKTLLEVLDAGARRFRVPSVARAAELADARAFVRNGTYGGAIARSESPMRSLSTAMDRMFLREGVDFSVKVAVVCDPTDGRIFGLLQVGRTMPFAETLGWMSRRSASAWTLLYEKVLVSVDPTYEDDCTWNPTALVSSREFAFGGFVSRSREALEFAFVKLHQANVAEHGRVILMVDERCEDELAESLASLTNGELSAGRTAEPARAVATSIGELLRLRYLAIHAPAQYWESRASDALLLLTAIPKDATAVIAGSPPSLLPTARVAAVAAYRNVLAQVVADFGPPNSTRVLSRGLGKPPEECPVTRSGSRELFPLPGGNRPSRAGNSPLRPRQNPSFQAIPETRPSYST